MNFTYQRNKEDVLVHSIWHRMIKSKFNLALNIIFPVFGIASLFGAIGIDSDPIMYVAVGYLICYPLITYGFIKLRIHTIFKNPDLVFDITTYTISAAGINTSSDKGVFLLEWTELYQIYETKGYIYLYLDKRNSLLFNKTALGEEQTIAVKALIKQYAPSHTIKFK